MARRNLDYLRELALERIERLVDFAERIKHIEPELADRYGTLALALARKAQIHYPDFLKARVCRRCGAWLTLGVKARVRVKTRGKMRYISVTCLKCGYTRRYPLGRENLPKPWYYLYQRVSGEEHDSS